MSYNKTVWIDGEAPPINKANLNKIESALTLTTGFNTEADAAAAGEPPAYISTMRIKGRGFYRWDVSSSTPDIVPSGYLGSGGWVKEETEALEGAHGDGVSDDSSVIDALNVSCTTVDLLGKSYAYDGSFFPVAKFKNGVIKSSVRGEFDYTNTAISCDKVVTVGAFGTFKYLTSALDWLKSITIISGSVTISLLEHNSSDDASGSMTIDHYLFDHAQSSMVALSGPSMLGAVPTNSDMTSDQTADLTLCRSRYAASIRLEGDDGISGSYGLACPNGLRAITDILIESHTRYSLDFGFNGSHSNSISGGGVILNNCAVFGGVWGVIAVDRTVTLSGNNFFGYQISGGPLDLIKCELSIGSSGKQYFFSPGVAAHPLQPKYVLNLESSTVNAHGYSGVINCKGPFLHGYYAKGQSVVDAAAPVFDGVTQPCTAMDGSYVVMDGYSITNADPANTELTLSAEQFGVRGNDGQGSLIFAGGGATVSVNGGSISNSVCQKYMTAQGGKLIGWGNNAITGSKATVRAMIIDSSYGTNIALTVSSPQGGSIDTVEAYRGASAVIRSSSGVSFTPALDTQSGSVSLYST